MIEVVSIRAAAEIVGLEITGDVAVNQVLLVVELDQVPEKGGGYHPPYSQTQAEKKRHDLASGFLGLI